MQSLYPEGEAICHNVLVHPPSGLVGGDVLDIRVTAQAGTHGLVTTPGATRFYRSEGQPACQHSHLHLHPGSRLEWLPLEAIAYDGCLARNTLDITLEAGAQLLGWDICALGLPLAGQPFQRGRFEQHLHARGLWLERGVLDAADTHLLDSPLGLDGQRCLGTLFFLSGSPLPAALREQALEQVRALLDAPETPGRAGVTSPHPQVLVLRVLAPLVEPTLQTLRQVWALWRSSLWKLPASAPRIWAT